MTNHTYAFKTVGLLTALIRKRDGYIANKLIQSTVNAIIVCYVFPGSPKFHLYFPPLKFFFYLKKSFSIWSGHFCWKNWSGIILLIDLFISVIDNLLLMVSVASRVGAVNKCAPSSSTHMKVQSKSERCHELHLCARGKSEKKIFVSVFAPPPSHELASFSNCV